MSRWVVPAMVLFALAACQRPLEARLAQGEAAANGARWEAARDAFAKAVDLEPGSARAHGRLGVALWQLGRRDDARAAWSRALELDPAEPDARLGLGQLELEAGDAGAALLRLAAVDAPTAVAGYLVRARAALLRGNPDDAQHALDDAQAARALAPDDAEARYLEGAALIALRRFADAQQTLEGLQQAHPRSPLGAYGLARLAAAQGRATDALLHLSTAKMVSGPDWAPARVAADPAFAFLTDSADFKTLVSK